MGADPFLRLPDRRVARHSARLSTPCAEISVTFPINVFSGIAVECQLYLRPQRHSLDFGLVQDQLGVPILIRRHTHQLVSRFHEAVLVLLVRRVARPTDQPVVRAPSLLRQPGCHDQLTAGRCTDHQAVTPALMLFPTACASRRATLLVRQIVRRLGRVQRTPPNRLHNLFLGFVAAPCRQVPQLDVVVYQRRDLVTFDDGFARQLIDRCVADQGS